MGTMNIDAAQARLSEIAFMAAGSSEKNAANIEGGQGRIGWVNGHAVKFSTNAFARTFSPTTKQMIANCNNLRETLYQIAQSYVDAGKIDGANGQRTLDAIRGLLGLKDDGTVAANYCKKLLDRKVVAQVINTIQQNAVEGSGADKIWENRKAMSENEASKAFGSDFEIVSKDNCVSKTYDFRLAQACKTITDAFMSKEPLLGKARFQQMLENTQVPGLKLRADFDPSNRNHVEEVVNKCLHTTNPKVSQNLLSFLNGTIPEDLPEMIDKTLTESFKKTFEDALKVDSKSELSRGTHKAGFAPEFLRVSNGGKMGESTFIDKTTINGQKVDPNNHLSADEERELEESKGPDNDWGPYKPLTLNNGNQKRIMYELIKLLPDDVANRNDVLYCATFMAGLQGPSNFTVEMPTADVGMNEGIVDMISRGAKQDGDQMGLGMIGGVPAKMDFTVVKDGEGKAQKLVFTQTYTYGPRVTKFFGAPVEDPGHPCDPLALGVMTTKFTFDLTAPRENGVPPFTVKTEQVDTNAL